MLNYTLVPCHLFEVLNEKVPRQYQYLKKLVHVPCMSFFPELENGLGTCPVSVKIGGASTSYKGTIGTHLREEEAVEGAVLWVCP